MSTGPVVVGVDDSGDARSAVLWAAQQASLTGTSLLIVHSPPLPPAATPSGVLSAALHASDDVGRSVLQDSAALARATQPEVLVRTLLSHAEPAHALVDLSAEADLLVLGSRSTVEGKMSLLASKRLQVSAHAHCPVLLLGPVATFGSPQAVSTVVAGVTGSRAGQAALAYATAEAARREAVLRLVRVEPAAGASRHVGRPDEASGDLLSAKAREIRRQHPNLTVLTDLVTGTAAELLPAYSDSSSILVVGCRYSDDQWNARLGPVATSAVRRNRGAVVVVGAGSDDRWAASEDFRGDGWSLPAGSRA